MGPLPESRAAAGRPRDPMRAPIRSSGTMTRRIGRRRSESSPVIVARERMRRQDPGQHAHGAAGIAGIEHAGGRRQAAQAAARRSVSVRPLASRPVSSIETPRPRRQRSVDAQSPPVE